MSQVDRQVRRARLRLTGNLLFDRLSLGVLLAGGLWGVSALVARAAGFEGQLWYGGLIAAGLAALFTLVATSVARPDMLRAAVALDRAAGLKERLSTAMTIRDPSDPFARAALEDAEKAAGHVHVPTHIRRQVPARWPMAMAVVLAAVLLVQFMPVLKLFERDAKAQERVPREMVQAEHKVISAAIKEGVTKVKDLADERGLKDLAEQLEDIELPLAATDTPEDIRREALKHIRNVEHSIEKQLALGEQQPVDEIKRRLARMQPQSGEQSTSKLSQALASGDFEGAREAMEDLKKQIAQAAEKIDDPAVRQKLEQMQNQLAQLADQLTQVADAAEIQKELERKAGLSPEEAAKLLEKLSKLDPKQMEKELQRQLAEKGLSQQQIQQVVEKIQKQQQACQQLQKLADALKSASQACQQCQGGGSGTPGQGASSAANALSSAISELSALEMSEQLMCELQAQLADLGKLRDDVCQGNCGGGNQPTGLGSQGPQYGRGIGERIGKERTAYQTDPTKAPTRPQGGVIIGQMLIDGPQVRGEATAAAVDAARSEVRDALDAIEREEVPRLYQKTLNEYFTRLAGIMSVPRPAEASGASSEERTPAE